MFWFRMGELECILQYHYSRKLAETICYLCEIALCGEHSRTEIRVGGATDFLSLPVCLTCEALWIGIAMPERV